MKYILRKFWCNSNLQTSVFIYGILASVFSGLLLITTLSTDLFKDHRSTFREDGYHYYYEYSTTETTSLYWMLVFLLIAHMISSIFLAIGIEKKNAVMLTPWMITQAITFVPFIPITVGVIFCCAVVSFPVYIWWAVFSIFMTQKAEEAHNRGPVPSVATPIAATAPSSAIVYSNTFEDIQLPAYNDVVPGDMKYSV